jgi:hypothetical protein
MEIRIKKLPPHWRYLVSRRQIKEAVADASERIRVVEFSGTGLKPSKLTGSLNAGQCDARIVGMDWCFRLRFRGLPENVLGLTADDLTPKILAGVCEFLAEHTGNVRAIPVQHGRRRILWLRSENEVLVPSFKTETLDGFWEKLELRSPWW